MTNPYTSIDKLSPAEFGYLVASYSLVASRTLRWGVGFDESHSDEREALRDLVLDFADQLDIHTADRPVVKALAALRNFLLNMRTV